MPETQTIQAAKTKPNAFQATLRGCIFGVLLVVFIIVFMFGVIVFRASKMPQYQKSQKCSEHMITLRSAIDRYKIRTNGAYPKNLEELKPYLSLKDREAFYCPLDTKRDKPSYTYTHPKPGSPDDTLLLSCDRHTFTMFGHTARMRLFMNIGGYGGVKPMDSMGDGQPVSLPKR